MLAMPNHKVTASNRSSPNPNAPLGVMIQIISLTICCWLETCEWSKIAIIIAEGIRVFLYMSRYDHQRSDVRNILTKEAPNPVVLLLLIDSQTLPKVPLEPWQQQDWQFFVRKFTSFKDGAKAVSRISIDAMYSIASLHQALVTVKSGTSLRPDASITIGEIITIKLSRETGCSEQGSSQANDQRI